jgi:hypothetical protein
MGRNDKNTSDPCEKNERVRTDGALFATLSMEQGKALFLFGPYFIVFLFRLPFWYSEMK